MPSLLIVSLVVAVVWLVFWLLVRRPQVRRRESLARLLDLADEVEGLLTTSQKHMGALQSLLQRVPSDIGAVAQASLEQDLPILEAKRDVLQHRLWIQKHGLTASQAELDAACEALDRARERIGGQLAALESAGADLASATAAADAAALREPPTLRRQPGT